MKIAFADWVIWFGTETVTKVQQNHTISLIDRTILFLYTSIFCSFNEISIQNLVPVNICLKMKHTLGDSNLRRLPCAIPGGWGERPGGG